MHILVFNVFICSRNKTFGILNQLNTKQEQKNIKISKSTVRPN